MAVTSYMDFFDKSFAEGSTKFHGKIFIDYRVKYDKPIVKATIEYHVNDEGTAIDYNIVDHGRKVRNTQADRDRAYYLLQVASRYRRVQFD